MNLQELKEKMYVENVRIFKEYFLEDDYDTSYVITNTEDDEDFKIVNRDKLMNFIHNDLKLEYVEEDFCLGLLNGQAVRIEYL